MKKCFKCGLEKPIEDFYKHPQMADGHLGKCKECNKKDVKENYQKNTKNPEYWIKERGRGREKFHRLYEGVYKKTTEESRKYNEKYPEKYKAKLITGNAIKYGKLIKQPCEICGEIKVQAHHDDYSKPLEVRWLCVKHHNEYHVKKREEELWKNF